MLRSIYLGSRRSELGMTSQPSYQRSSYKVGKKLPTATKREEEVGKQDGNIYESYSRACLVQI